MLEAKIHLQGRVDRTKELSLLSNVECAKQTDIYERDVNYLLIRAF